jgi:hypothetical protein
MARRDESILNLLAECPWWVSVAVSGVAFVFLRFILASIDFGGMAANSFVEGLFGAAPFFAIVPFRDIYGRQRDMSRKQVSIMISLHKIPVFIVVMVTYFISLSGCVPPITKGRDFKAPLRDELVLGKTEKSEVVRLFGKPEEVETKPLNGANHEIYYYSYRRGEYPKPWTGKRLQVEFRNNIVHGYVFVSSLPEDYTNFDEKNIDKIEVNTTKKIDILNLFGPPHGRSLLPSVRVSQEITGVDKAVELWQYVNEVFIREERGRSYQGHYLVKKLSIFLDANGIAIKKLAVIPESQPPGKIDRSFIAFKDASPCRDYGDLAPVLKSDAKVLQFPFCVRNNEEGEIERQGYPLTEGKIDEYIAKALQSSQKLFVPDKDFMSRAEVISKYFLDVLSNAALGKGSPLEWGGNIPEGVLDKNLYIYFPIGIGRESKHHVNARCYILIADFQGKIIFARCIPYNPNEWSADIEVFKRDVKGKLPLAP